MEKDTKKHWSLKIFYKKDDNNFTFSDQEGLLLLNDVYDLNSKLLLREVDLQVISHNLNLLYRPFKDGYNTSKNGGELSTTDRNKK